MEKFEVLSPAGDMECLKTAIKAGADAVYFGLNKFNARMKADNISLDNLAQVVEFAHIRGVKLYVTINTLVSNSELTELVGMVGECLKVGVDAFIVQDYGVIFALKRVYPNIVLHGSTQLGVHNVRGARVAKKLGLSRVVLSREVTLEDIRHIRENVDIELEVFVQGAMCVAFSGNCYLSSIKHGASGNRGLCKQLCRLPYTLSNNKSKIKGYTISPRDNCMIDYLRELCDLGVVSFKIEGRLRRAGYVSVATRTYRNAIDSIINKEPIDTERSKADLKKVFARGEYISGYFQGNDIIDTNNNSHMGQELGVVVKCDKFKDIYRLTIDSKHELHKGDGIKCLSGNDVIAFGVGNIEKSGNNIQIYVKNYVQSNSRVFRVLDSEFESVDVDNTRLMRLSMMAKINVGRPILVILKSGDKQVQVEGAIVQEAKSKPLTQESVISQLTKVGDDFVIDDIDVNLSDNAFMPVSEINAVRRDAIQKLKTEILNSYKIDFHKCDQPDIIHLECGTDKIAIVDEFADLSKVYTQYSRIILSPTIYSVDVIKKFAERYKQYFSDPLILNLPVIALKDDLEVLDSIVDVVKKKGYTIVANNIYALDYLNDGIDIIAGSNMNITNDWSATCMKELGVTNIISSIEKWCSGIVGAYKMCKGKRVLMTFAHCPNKTLQNGYKSDNDCSSNCLHRGTLNLKGDGVEYSIRRYKVANCYFELVDSVVENKSSNMQVDDLRS